MRADTQVLQDLVVRYAKTLGMSSREIDGALTKHKEDLRTYVRTLRDRVQKANAHLEAQHNKRWYEQESTKSQARHTKEKDEQYAEMLAERQKKTLPFRLQSVLAKAELYESNVKSPALGANGGQNSEEPIGPPGTTFKKKVPTIDLEDSCRVILKHIERCERRVDGFLGLCPPEALTEREKGALLDELKGMHSREVSESFPELGSQRTVEVWRKERDPDCQPSTGLTK